MDTVVAHSDFLNALLRFLTRDIFTDIIEQRSKIILDNHRNYHTYELQAPHIEAIHILVNELSACLTLPDEFIARFNREPVKIQLFLYDRYQFALGELDPNWDNHITFTVPSQLNELFKWFFITLWGE